MVGKRGSVHVKASAPKGGESDSYPGQMLDAKECALLLLRLIEVKADGAKPLSRFRLAELSLQRMWGRKQITQEFVGEVNEWLFRAGRVLFYAGGTFGVLSTNVVDRWSGLTSKLIAAETREALAGKYDFTSLERLLIIREDVGEDDS